jgi:hypothetical protein
VPPNGGNFIAKNLLPYFYDKTSPLHKRNPGLQAVPSKMALNRMHAILGAPVKVVSPFFPSDMCIAWRH